MGIAVERAYIREHQHRYLLVEKLPDCLGGSARRLAHLAIRPESPGEVICRGQKRLRLIGSGSRDEPDPAALASLVEEVNGSG